jgi:uncharacterized protein YecT (DUF1311 family)
MWHTSPKVFKILHLKMAKFKLAAQHPASWKNAEKMADCESQVPKGVLSCRFRRHLRVDEKMNKKFVKKFPSIKRNHLLEGNSILWGMLSPRHTAGDSPEL